MNATQNRIKMNYIKNLLVSIILIFSVQLAVAQADKGAIRVGGGLAYGTGVESLGINARGDFAITNNILLAPGLVYFFGSSSYDWFDINLNGKTSKYYQQYIYWTDFIQRLIQNTEE